MRQYLNGLLPFLACAVLAGWLFGCWYLLDRLVR